MVVLETTLAAKLAEFSLARTAGAFLTNGANVCGKTVLDKITGGTVARIAGHLGLPANLDAPAGDPQGAALRAPEYAEQLRARRRQRRIARCERPAVPLPRAGHRAPHA